MLGFLAAGPFASFSSSELDSELLDSFALLAAAFGVTFGVVFSTAFLLLFVSASLSLQQIQVATSLLLVHIIKLNMLQWYTMYLTPNAPLPVSKVAKSCKI